jgi:alginate O-acetyltransferase complex protein AlgI
MIFNDWVFLFLFLPLTVLTVLGGTRGSLRVWCLAFASIGFYAAAGVEHAVVLVASVLWVYILTRSSRIVGNRPLVTLAILGPFAALVAFKYLGFFGELVGVDREDDETFNLFGNVLLPAGISFFTIQMIGFSLDRYHGRFESPKFPKFLLFVTFFPQLVAGPIVRLPQVREALDALPHFRLLLEDVSVAARYLVLGLAWKVLIADGLGLHTARLAEDPETLGISALCYLILAYSFQIFFDFFGYSLAAIGLGRLFGFRLPVNFIRPYESHNPRDFWRRWHVTLSFWIRDYIYLPIGGNRRYALNIMIVFALCGLWHGAGLAFIVWGLVHGAMVVGYSLFSKVWDLAPRLVQIVATFSMVSVAWLLFLFDLEGVIAAVGSIGIESGADVSLDMLSILLVAAVVCFGVRPERLAEGDIKNPAPLGAGFALLFCVTLMFLDRSGSFIYFRF